MKRTKRPLAKNKIEVSSSKEEGWFKETQRVRYDGAEFKFKVDLDSLREILKYTTKGKLNDVFVKFEHDTFIYISVISV